MVLEFDNDGSAGASQRRDPAAVRRNGTQLADKIVAAINAANLGMTAYATGNGRVNLGAHRRPFRQCVASLGTGC